MVIKFRYQCTLQFNVPSLPVLQRNVQTEFVSLKLGKLLVIVNKHDKAGMIKFTSSITQNVSGNDNP